MAGVAFPTFVIVFMMLTPYLDRNPSRRPQDRRVAIVLFTTMGDSSWWLSAGARYKLPALLGVVALGMLAYGASLALLGFRWRDFSRRGAA